MKDHKHTLVGQNNQWRVR